MKQETLEMIEEYNSNGVCVKRTINGFDLPPDKEPSVVIFRNLKSITQKFYMTKEEARQRFGNIKL